MTKAVIFFRANTECYSWAVGTLSSYVRGRGFESWLWDRCPDGSSLWISCVSPGQCQISTESFRPLFSKPPYSCSLRNSLPTPDIAPPLLSDQKTLRTEIPCPAVFWWTATLDIAPDIAANKQWRYIGSSLYSRTSVHELNSFLKVVRKPKCS